MCDELSESVGVCVGVRVCAMFGDCVRKGCVGGVSGCVSESSLLALKLSAICF